MEYFRYTRAICRAVPRSLAASTTRMDNNVEVDYDAAVDEHSTYVQTLRDLGLQVAVLPAIERLPESAFIEDTAIVIGNKALIANLGHQNRNDEAASIMHVLKGLNVQVSVMQDPATVDGADVLFTGREIFIGMSSRSNEASLDVFQRFFPEYPVHSVKVEEALRLKSMMSMCDEDTLLVGSSQHAESACNELMQKAEFLYKVVRIPDDNAANCLMINEFLVYRAASEFPESAKVLKGLRLPGMEVQLKELSKVNGSVSCYCLLLQ